MLKSMTGYGVVQGQIGSRRVVIETKSVNHKFCEVNCRIPPRLAPLEGKLVEFTKASFSRGRLDVLIKDESSHGAKTPAQIDLHRLQGYHQMLQKVAKRLKIPGQIPWEALLALPHVVVTEEEEDVEKLWGQLKPLLKSSFLALERMRRKEGSGLEKVFIHGLKSLSQQVKAVETLIPKNIEDHQRQLLDRIHKLTPGLELDMQRLAQEVAYFVDRTDISEELQRLSHHLDHFHEILKEHNPLGRKLDFLLQEMNREVNTLSSKAQNALISQHVVECKHLLEKMREQVQNVE